MYPPVNEHNIAKEDMENGPFVDDLLSKKYVFHSQVCLPQGNFVKPICQPRLFGGKGVELLRPEFWHCAVSYGRA